MAERSVREEKVVISPMFDIPEGVSDFEYEELGSASGDIDYADGEVVGETVNEDSDLLNDTFVDGADLTDYSDGPESPNILGVLSQTLRTTGSGGQVIDVVLDVEDVGDLSKYEIRVAKA